MQTPLPNLPNLPMHLALTLGYTLSWPIALQCANAGLLPLKNPLLEKLPHKKLAESLHREAKNRSAELLQAIQRFTEQPYARDVNEPPCIWQKGRARLLDFSLSQRGRAGAASAEALAKVDEGCPPSAVALRAMADKPNLPPMGGGIVLFVPSLINRYYILDLEKERSMLRFLATQNIYPLVLDWGTPGEMEENFSVAGYVTEILLPAIDFIHRTSGEQVTLAGYCMGGVFSVAAAQLRPKKIGKLALFATPWDFHCKEFSPFILDTSWQQKISELLKSEIELPAGIIQALFYLTDPFVFEDKFRRFLSLDVDSRAAKDFIALEHWVNDGVPMTSQVAQDCLIGWAQQNQLAAGSWQVAGKKINPAKIKQPAFIAIPKHDHVVPQDCALPLAKLLPHTHIVNPSSGHVGMMVGSRAKSECWLPLVEWLNA